MNRDIFSGNPSIILKQRPFYSIVVPCYNSRKTLGSLLDSIVAQNMNDEIEVVLSDDCSTESYQDIVDKYSNVLSIKQIQTDYNFAPSNTREKGISVAEGEWICFADHDDEFAPNVLQEIKETIVTVGEDQFVIADFYEMNPDSREIIQEFYCERNLMHAKFFNLDNFWKKYDLHFKKDLLTHEDIHLLSQANYASLASGKTPLYINMFVYYWMSYPTSLSRKNYKDDSFLEVFFKNYLDATGYSYQECFYKYGAGVNFTFISMIEIVVYCYFYMQGIIFYQKYNLIGKNEEYARKYLRVFKKMFGVSNQQIVDVASENEADMYIDVRKSVNLYVGQFIESETFIQFLNRLDEDIPTRTTMSQVMRKEYL